LTLSNVECLDTRLLYFRVPAYVGRGLKRSGVCKKLRLRYGKIQQIQYTIKGTVAKPYLFCFQRAQTLRSQCAATFFYRRVRHHGSYSLLYLLPSADGTPSQALLATSSQTRPRLRLGSKDAFWEETLRDFERLFLPYAGGGGERPAAKCVATFFYRRVRHHG